MEVDVLHFGLKQTILTHEIGHIVGIAEDHFYHFFLSVGDLLNLSQKIGGRSCLPFELGLESFDWGRNLALFGLSIV